MPNHYRLGMPRTDETTWLNSWCLRRASALCRLPEAISCRTARSSHVAVGLALAAHMAPETMGGVSVVVVPHNLEANPGLETDLRSEHSAVLGGVVLGGPDRISEDTRDLLRQILRQPERAAILEAVHSSLGDVGAILAAALALIGALAVAKTTVPVIADSTIATLHSGFDTVRRQIERERVTLAEPKINKDGPVTTDDGSETHAERKVSFDRPFTAPRSLCRCAHVHPLTDRAYRERYL